MKKQKRRGRGLTILIVILALALTGAIVWGVAMAAQSLIQYGDSAQIGQKEEEEQISGESMDQEADTAPVEPELQEGLPRNRYDPARHRGIAELYVMDERFTAYYDKRLPGCARFLRDAVVHWAQ